MLCRLPFHALVRITQDAPPIEDDAALFHKRVDCRTELLTQARRVRFAVFFQKRKTRRLLRRVFDRNVLREPGIGPIGLGNLARAHFGRNEQPEAERQRHTVAPRDRPREPQAFGIDGGSPLLHAVDLFQFFGGIVARLLHAHDKTRRRAPSEGHGDAGSRLDGHIAYIVEDLVHFAVRNIDDDLANHFRIP